MINMTKQTSSRRSGYLQVALLAVSASVSVYLSLHFAAYRDWQGRRPEEVAERFSYHLANAELGQASRWMCQELRAAVQADAQGVNRTKLLQFFHHFLANQGLNSQRIWSIDLSQVQYRLVKRESRQDLATIQLSGYYTVHLLYGRYEQLLDDHQAYRLQKEKGEWKVCEVTSSARP